MEKEYIVVLDNVSKTLNGVKILKNVNYKFEPGKIYGLHGTNGSGKTMLLRMIAGLIKPDSGTVFIKQEELHKNIDFPRSIGVLIENPNFWKHYTAFQVMVTLASIKNEVNKEEIKATMERVGLNWNDKRQIKKYSLGMKQRLGIAQAIMEKPEIILLDEPTNALDQDGICLIEKIIKEECKRGAVVILASHNIRDLDNCDELICIDRGMIK